MKNRNNKLLRSILAVMAIGLLSKANGYSQAREFQIKKTIENKKEYLNVPDSFNREQVRNSDAWKNNTEYIVLDTIKINEGETFNKPSVELLSEINIRNNPWWDQQNDATKGKIRIEIGGRGFGQKTYHFIEYRYVSGRGNGFWIGSRQGNLNIFGGSEWPVKGPATISLKLSPYRQGPLKDEKGWHIKKPLQHWRLYYTKNILNFAQTKTQLQALVLPKNTKNTRLVVESSEDLVNWKLDTPGPKTTTNRERFFRLRAVKE